MALAVFLMVTVSHYRRKEDTGAKGWILILAGLATLVTLVLFAIHTLDEEPQTFVAMIVIFALAIIMNFGWKTYRDSHLKTDVTEDAQTG